VGILTESDFVKYFTRGWVPKVAEPRLHAVR